MTDHPLKMKDRLKGKKRPTRSCKILIGDPDEYQQVTNESFASLIELLRANNNDVTEEMQNSAVEILKGFEKAQEPFFQEFVFRAMKPKAFEDLADEPEYSPRDGVDEKGYNTDTFPKAVFFECLVTPDRNSLSDEEWEEFLDSCSYRECRDLFDTAMEANARRIQPSTPKDLMTRN